ncbi:MAG: hypothetical protein A3J38_06080 [Gammaproteobacteria bacterium RIFCSPHIGHO2_12_FULL_45_9]|nr:MAG: hypothetical protein A3J38_06080 [Gammaproteobacteria bacterium RIFCSPHIGHO2_12_FULL_45_9]
MLKRTALYDLQQALNARFVDFGGWELPLHFGSQLEEHHSVRKQMGLFDVSHMGVFDIAGQDAALFLRTLLANDVARLRPKQALYSCLLNETGGILDDLIVYQRDSHQYRVVVNASTLTRDWEWFQANAPQSVHLTQMTERVLLALQGPAAFSVLSGLFDHTTAQALTALSPFTFLECGADFIARTGYTGEDGLEMILTPDRGRALWQALIEKGVAPCGLGARDTLRLEAGFNLYGSDMTENTMPAESNVAWTVSNKDPARDFIGKRALADAKTTHRLTGLVMLTPGVLRHGQAVLSASGQPVGEITSGTFSPTLQHAIALARLNTTHATPNTPLWVDRRGEQLPVYVVRPPFVRHGAKVFELTTPSAD